MKNTRFLYIIPVISLCIGMFVGVTEIRKDALKISSGMQRFKMPGLADIVLDKPGQYTVFWEYKTVIDGVPVDTSDRKLNNLQARLVSKETEEAIVLSGVGGKTNFNFGRYAGKAIFVFETDQTGDYIFEVRHGGADAYFTTFSIAHDIAGFAFGLILKILIILIVTMAVTLACIQLVSRYAPKEDDE